ncbi:helix-turn-helix domain-containing protein [Alloiococcus sp. CFN-8]|uniref:helix-turn-helix domain-containing protein n=1 Tax=Alloiococcus sp. CFN-8 TaxID=3416081 RepID=UPI003CE7D28B
MVTLGSKISSLRKAKGIKQEELAERLGVSPQAVSKWENDISCPDIMLLPRLADIFGVTVDELLSREEKKQTQIIPEEKRKNIDDMMFRIYVNSSDGDKVKITLPMPLIKMGLEMGMAMPQVSGNDALKGIDFTQLISMVEKGVIGKLVEVETSDGDIVEIVVE